ncbi:MAG: divalent metal cation transporter [Phycisphaera sp. RhM]|nr:divalent metal cation transporter [Phycisphaera sp. RhM]
MNDTDSPRPGLLGAIGPGLISACVVIGPGSILTSTGVGADAGFSKIWVVVLSVMFMLSYVTMGMRLGAVTQRSNGDLVAQHLNRFASIVIGISVFFISATFQFGNNLGAHSALSAYVPFDYWPVVLNAIVLAVLFGFQDLYRFVERAMTLFVAMMLIAFALNLFFAKPDLGELAAGFLPSIGEESGQPIGLPLLGLIGTTFVMSIAYYQAYLVRFKGLSEKSLSGGMLDAVVSAVIMALITIMIMSTAAAVLRGEKIENVGQVANQLQPLFGEKGRAIFCLGLFSAAFSSFIVNSMVGGFILADSLKLGSTPSDRAPRVLTAVVLLIGMGVAIYVIKTGIKPVGAIVAAQAVTVLASPFIAAAMLWLTSSEAVMGKRRNGPFLKITGTAGLLLLVAMSYYTASTKVIPALFPDRNAEVEQQNSAKLSATPDSPALSE